MGDALGLVTQLARRAAHHEPVRRRESSLARDIVLPVRDIHVEGTVDLEHQDPSIAKAPLAIGEAPSSRRIPPAHLASGQGEPERPTQPSDIDLSDRLRPTGDVDEHPSKPRGSAQRVHPVDPLEQVLRRGQALLDDRREHAFRGPGGLLPRREAEDRRFDPAGRQVRRGPAQILGRSPGSDVLDARVTVADVNTVAVSRSRCRLDASFEVRAARPRPALPPWRRHRRGAHRATSDCSRLSGPVVVPMTLGVSSTHRSDLIRWRTAHRSMPSAES